MKINLDKETQKRLKQLAKDERRTIKDQAEIILSDAVMDIELSKTPPGFIRDKK